jgi:uncharacterized protein YjcR
MRRSNHFTAQEIDALKEAFLAECFDYQLDWYRAVDQRTRVILKSRQIGTSFYFAREALIDALTTGRNQIFVAASLPQALLFKVYMQDFVQQVLGRQLAGTTIELANGARLHFISAGSRTFSALSGNVYADEFFWFERFGVVNNIIKGIAIHKGQRKTYFSSRPLTLTESHQDALDWWNGERIDVSHQALAQGRLCADGIWRQVVTIEDAFARGNRLVDVEQLRAAYSTADFDALFMCRLPVAEEIRHG